MGRGVIQDRDQSYPIPSANMSASPKRSGIGRSLLVLCLVLGVATAGVGAWVLDQPRNLVGGLGELGGGQLLLGFTGTLSVPSGSGNATLTIAVRNPLGAPPLVSVGFGGSGDNPGSFPNAGQLELSSQGRPMSPVNPLPPGATACGSIVVRNVTAGDAYTVVANATSKGGYDQVETIDITAQLGGGGCSSTYAQSSSETSSCDPATPMSLEQIGPVDYSNFGNSSSYPSLVVVWWNCSSQLLNFTMIASPLLVTTELNGTIEHAVGILDTSFQNSTRVVGGDGGVGFTLPIVFSPPLEPGTTILHVNGTISAVNAITHKPLSAGIAFGT